MMTLVAGGQDIKRHSVTLRVKLDEYPTLTFDSINTENINLSEQLQDKTNCISFSPRVDSEEMESIINFIGTQFKILLFSSLNALLGRSLCLRIKLNRKLQLN